MPSYADEYAARFPDLQGRASGPVRITISRGDSVLDHNGRHTYTEHWEQEEIMEVEAAGSLDAEATTSQMDGQGAEDQLVDTIRERFSVHQKRKDIQRHSLLVLDTNVLLSTLPFLATFFTQCLSRNVFALSNSSFPPSPISLIIPHTVLSELDNLKTSAKSHVGSAARAANNWILTALQTQKRQMYDVIESRSRRRQNIPERSWVVHVENAAHATALDGMGRSAGNLTPDEEIVRLCVSLNKQAEFDVFFCSDDTNARTRAEIEGLPTFSFKELVRDAHGKEASKEELAQLATDLIEQWQSQIQGLEHTPCPPNLMERMEEVDHPMSSPPPAKEVTKTKSAIDKDPSKRTQHRRHAQKTEPKEKSRNGAITREPIPSTKSYPCKVRQDSQAKQSPVITTNTNTYKHQYPDDRSTSSSMWAA